MTLPVIGFVLSIILTLIALWAVMNRVLGAGSLIALILILGAIQIFIQLFFFMHVTESKGPNWHAWMLALGLVFVIAIVAGSIWIMAFGALSY
ncbi:MAG: cytochrome C oxidase subunit IV family protein [Alicyclobacillus sp.]|nr:cytochrome C oxidase subunit IV family protein [Alicyclobacillus sp.]